MKEWYEGTETGWPDILLFRKQLRERKLNVYCNISWVKLFENNKSNYVTAIQPNIFGNIYNKFHKIISIFSKVINERKKITRTDGRDNTRKLHFFTKENSLLTIGSLLF